MMIFIDRESERLLILSMEQDRIHACHCMSLPIASQKTQNYLQDVCWLACAMASAEIALFVEESSLRLDHAEASINQMGFMSQRLIQPVFPAAMPVQLPDSARRLGDSVPLIVGGEPIQALHPAQNTAKRKQSKQGDRGQDKKQRKASTCKSCIQSENQERMEGAQCCPERAAGGTCLWQCQDALMG
jgi:hypothetical protein